MKFLLRCSSNDENYNADCDYCIIEIDKKLAQEILRRRKAFLGLKKDDDALWEMFFWGGTQECINAAAIINEGNNLISAEDAELLSSNGYIELKVAHDHLPEGSYPRTECEQVGIRENGVFWTCMPKYVDGIYPTSEELPYSLIEKLL